MPRTKTAHSGHIRALKPAKALKFRIDPMGSLRASVSASSGEFNLTPEILQLLCLMQKGIQPPNLAQELKAQFKAIIQSLPETSEIKELIEDLQNAQCLVDPKTSPLDSGIEDGFGDPWIQWAMLSDQIRCRAYKASIQKLVGEKSYVLDVGAGTGLLSLYALESGAQGVEAIEETGIVRTLKALREQLPQSMRSRLAIQNCNSFDATISEKINLVVSELFGNDPLQEGIISTLGDVFSRINKQKCAGIPDRFSLYVQLIDITSGPLHERIKLLTSDRVTKNNSDISGIDRIKKVMNLKDISFTHPLRVSEFESSSAQKQSITIPLAPPPPINSQPPKHEFEIISLSKVVAPVILVGFRAFLTSTNTISNIPGEKDFCEHWSPILIPLNRTLQNNEILKLKLAISDNWDRILAEIHDDKKNSLGSRR